MNSNLRPVRSDIFKRIEFCPICGSTDRKNAWKIAKDPRFSPQSFGPSGHNLWASIDYVEVLQCADCGLRYRSEYFRTEVYDKVYTDKYHDGLESLKHDRLWQQRLSRIKRVQTGGELLDIGCGYGSFLSLAASDFSCTGVEVSRTACRKAAENTALEIHCDRLEKVRFANDFFDVITLWDVLEHIVSPHELMREIARILKPGGTLWICTGDTGAILPRILRSRWSYYCLIDHICFYDLKLLKWLLNEHDLRMIDSFYENASVSHLIKFFRLVMVVLTKQFLATSNSFVKTPQLSTYLRSKGEPAIPDFSTQIVVVATK